MQIASLFAKAGFIVDASGLTAFRTEMQTVKKEMGETLRVINKVNASLKGVTTRFRSIQGLFDPSKMTAWRTSIGAATRQYVRTIQASSAAIDKLATVATNDSVRLNRFHLVLEAGVGKVTNYAQSLYHLEAAMLRLNAAIRARPIISTPRASNAGAGQGGRSGGGGAAAAAGVGESLFASWGIGRLLKPMLPSGMGIGGMLGTGYALKELVATGREMMALEMKMTAVSNTTMDFANNMKYVRKVSQDLGLDLLQTGNAYANIVVAAQDKLSPKKMQAMFTGFNKYYAAVHMKTADQTLANLAIQQMFGKDKIQAQEARLQMGQRVTPFVKLLTASAKEALGDKFTTFDDVMKKGMLDPSMLLPLVAEKLGKIAENNDALAQSLRNSQTAQQRFKNNMEDLSGAIMHGGLDKALAVLFRGLNLIIDILKPVGRFIMALAKSIKTMFDAVSNHPFITTVLMFVVAALAMWLVSLSSLLPAMWAVGGVLSAITARVAILNLAMIRLWGVIGLVVAAFSQLDGFLGGEQDNWLTVMAEGMEYLGSVMMLTFSNIRLSIAELMADIRALGTWKGVKKWLIEGATDGNGDVAGVDRIPNPSYLKLLPGGGIASGMIDWMNSKLQDTSYIPNYRSPMLPNSPLASSAQQPITNMITIDVSKLSPESQAAYKNGEGYNFGMAVGEAIRAGGLTVTPMH